MGKIRDMLSSGMTDGDRKEVEHALRQLSALHGMICAEVAGAFHLGYARQLTDKSSLLFDLAF